MKNIADSNEENQEPKKPVWWKLIEGLATAETIRKAGSFVQACWTWAAGIVEELPDDLGF